MRTLSMTRSVAGSMVLCSALTVGCATSQPMPLKGLAAAEQQTTTAVTRAEQAAQRAEAAANKATAAAERVERTLQRVEASTEQLESRFTQRMRK